MPRRTQILALLLAVMAVATGCGRKEVGEYDTSTPDKAVDAVAAMVRDGHAELLPRMVFLKTRDVTFEDGVTEASAVEDVRGKAGEMLGRLWRVSRKIQARWPDQVRKEVDGALRGRSVEDALMRVMADPFAALEAQRSKLTTEDMSDGTAALLWEGEPVLGGMLSLVETPEGWRLNVPVELVRTNRYWPDTRHEWAVVASMMLAIENSLIDFERELDGGKFRDLSQASARVGRLVGESVVVQGVIYAMMKRDDPAKAAAAPASGGADGGAGTPPAAP